LGGDFSPASVASNAMPSHSSSAQASRP
jgi:hypothetical protein